MSTGFEWLDRPFMLTRIWVTLVAILVFALIAYQMVYILMFVRRGPATLPRSDPNEEVETVRSSDRGDRRPLLELGVGAALASVPAWTVILVWLRPRAGFLLAAVVGLPLWTPLALLPAAWLCFAAWKVGRAPPNGILPPCG